MRTIGMRTFLSIVAVILSSVMVFPPVCAEKPGQLTTPQEEVPQAYFGMHIHRAGGATPWPSVPVKEWRLWDARVAWPDIEPQKGQWRFQTLDAYLALAAAHGANVIVPLGLSPRWASARPNEPSVYQPGFAAEPLDVGNWREYVAVVAAHCKGRVHAYEIWNEPNSKAFWTGSMRQLIQLTRVASLTIHRIDPSALVVSPSATLGSGVEWLSQFLAEGGGQYVDVIGFHFYVAPQPPEAMVPLIERVKSAMAQRGFSDKPLWNTESTWPAPKPFPSEDLAAAYLARAYILNWAAGVSRFYWYAWDNHAFTAIQTTQADNETLTPAGQAYGTIQKWLVGARVDSCVEDSSHTWTCRLSREEGPEWILWNPGGTVRFSVPPSWRAKSITPLLGERHALSEASVEIGPVPELLAATE